MEVSKDAHHSNGGVSEHFLTPAATQGKSDLRETKHDSLGHLGKTSLKSIFSLQEEEERNLPSGNKLQ